MYVGLNVECCVRKNISQGGEDSWGEVSCETIPDRIVSGNFAYSCAFGRVIDVWVELCIAWASCEV